MSRATRRIVKVFLASPGDLAEERTTARQVVDEVNSLWADYLGIQVELVGWEDTVSTHRRPQEAINRDLDQCEMFFGMLWKRWGTPPALSGPYTSGFHEEFERSVERFKSSGQPSISLAFKLIPEDILRDPGPEVTRVSDFQKKIVDSKELLYVSFADLSGFRRVFEQSVVRYIQNLHEEGRHDNRPEEGPERLPDSHTARPGDQAADSRASAVFSMEGAEYLKNLLTNSDGLESSDLTPLEVARFRLLSTIVSRPGNDSIFLGPHDANLIYRKDDDIALGREEKAGLLKSGLRYYASKNVPLWRWVREIQAIESEHLAVLTLVVSDEDHVKSNIIDLLRAAKIEVGLTPPIERAYYLDHWLSDKRDSRVRNAALNYIGVMGTSDDMPRVQTVLDKSEYQTREAALIAAVKIRLRESQSDGLDELIRLDTDSVPIELLDEVFSKPDALSICSVQSALSHRNPGVRYRSLRLLRSRQADVPELQSYLDDPSPEVRLEAMLLLHSNGHAFSDTQSRELLIKRKAPNLLSLSTAGVEEGQEQHTEYVRHKFSKMSDSELQDIYESSFLSYDAFIEHSLRSKRGLDRLRFELRDGFNSYVESGLSKLPDELRSRLDSVKVHFINSIVRASISAIESKNNKSDLLLVRDVLNAQDISWSDGDAHFLKRHGEWTDIQILIRNCQRVEYGGRSFLAISGQEQQYRIAADAIAKLGAARPEELLRCEMPSGLLSGVILKLPGDAVKKITPETVSRLLNHDSDNVRKTTCICLGRHKNRPAMRDILITYLKSPSVYYNVVHWLDLFVAMPRSVTGAIVQSECRSTT